MQPRERYLYSSPFTRPPLKLPDGKRMIVWPVVNVEEWEITRPMPRQMSIPPGGSVGAIPDMPNWTWHEYGMRVGIWRLIEAMASRKIATTISLNAKVCETCPEVAAAARDAGWEFMAHCWVQIPIYKVEDQPAMLQQSIAGIQKFTGKRPRGWLGPGRTQMLDTLEHVAAAGMEWFGDWVLDDQPFWVDTKNGPLVSLPYSVELNDITIMVSGQHDSDAMLRRTKDAFERLYQESAASARVMSFGVHPYVSGAAHRIKYFEEMLDWLAGHEDVVFMTGDEIYDWYVAQCPKPARGPA